MSNEKKDIDKVNEEFEIVAKYFKVEELAVIFNTLGEIPLKLNSQEIGFFSQLREKIKNLHDKSKELSNVGIKK